MLCLVPYQQCSSSNKQVDKKARFTRRKIFIAPTRAWPTSTSNSTALSYATVIYI